MPTIVDTPASDLQMYHYAIIDWVTALFPPVIDALSDKFVVNFSNAQREFTVVYPPNSQDLQLDTLSLPRASITPLDPEVDDVRINTGTMRTVCYKTAEKKVAQNVRYPVPVLLPYQIDIWTKYTSQILEYVQAAIFEFRGKVKNLQVDVDSAENGVYKTKSFPIRLDSIANTGDLEPSEDEVLQRHTLNITGEGWLFSRDLQDVKTVQSVQVDYLDGDPDLSTALETQTIT